MDTLTALEMIHQEGCGQLQQMPPLTSLTALQRLNVRYYRQLQQLPTISTLQQLQTLCLHHCEQLQQVPPLSSLSSLPLLHIRFCVQLQILPPLETLFMLQRLDLQGCENPWMGCLKLATTQSCKVYGVSAKRLHVLQAERFLGSKREHPGCKAAQAFFEIIGIDSTGRHFDGMCFMIFSIS
jgi:hypothetical protein